MFAPTSGQRVIWGSVEDWAEIVVEEAAAAAGRAPAAAAAAEKEGGGKEPDGDSSGNQ
jgi:hypothetical protein